jgi:hypothetical protein
MHCRINFTRGPVRPPRPKSTYKDLVVPGTTTRAGCWSHTDKMYVHSVGIYAIYTVKTAMKLMQVGVT